MQTGPVSRLCRLSALVLLLGIPCAASADRGAALREALDTRAKQLENKLIAWRRDLHAHPELGNRETRTAAIVARQLQALGLKVRTGVARTGVVGVLKGGLPGRVVGLRADMDGLPVKEASALRTTRASTAAPRST